MNKKIDKTETYLCIKAKKNSSVENLWDKNIECRFAELQDKNWLLTFVFLLNGGSIHGYLIQQHKKYSTRSVFRIARLVDH